MHWSYFHEHEATPKSISANTIDFVFPPPVLVKVTLTSSSDKEASCKSLIDVSRSECSVPEQK